MGIGETLCRALAKVSTRAAGEQVKTACGNLQLCAGLKDGIEGATHAVGQRILAQVRSRRTEIEEEEAANNEEEEREEGVAAYLNNLNIETAVTEEEVEEGLTEALWMEVWRTREMRPRKRVEGLNRHWKPLSYSLRKQIRAAFFSLMTVIISTS